MKKMNLLLATLFLAACSGEKSNPTPTLAETPESEPQIIADKPQVPALVEFVWHQKTEGYTDEALWSHTEYWSNLAGEAGWGLMAAAVMTPRFEDERFDFLWVMAWPTQEARNNAWEDWAANHEAAWLELTTDTFSYSADNAYSFAPSPGRQASDQNTSGVSVVEFMFCSYNEGKGEADRKIFESMHADYMDAYEAEIGATSYWWTVMTPTFELPAENKFDYMWTNFWSSDAERNAGWTAYASAPHASKGADDATCQEPAVFDSRVIYSPEA